MKLNDLLTTLTLDTVVNIEVDSTIIDSFTVKDYFYDKRNRMCKYDNCIIRAVTFIKNNIITVQTKKSVKIGIKKELICYKDGSFTFDNKPFENISELTNYLSSNY